MLSIIGENDPKDVHAGSPVKWPFSVSSDASKLTFTFTITTGPDGADAPEWTVELNDASHEEIWSNYGNKTEVKTDGPANGKKDFSLEVICPKGARYGDTVSVSVNVSAEGETDSMTFNARASQSIMVLKTQIDQEKVVSDSLAAKANIGEKDIYAILSPGSLRGYVFVEGMNTDRMHEKTRDIKKARSFIDGETTIEEISPYLVPLSTVVGIVEGDLVELISGPFKGEKARVQQIDQTKEEITVELIEAMVPIPVTVKGDSVRVIEKEK
ncbi:transcription elongation factor Spt5 [Candidatus Methanarcanum hacksteinii]|uniref:transcription elongation factor Spt5 n=1 Tax=Candidatus Methanarcanum hacksteinii TaxID=2911857 RepID=UPI0037DD62B1